MQIKIKSIEQIEKEHPDEWLKIEVTKMADDNYTPLEGRLIAHGKDSDKVGKKAVEYVKKNNIKKILSTYTGEITAEAVLI